MQKPILYQILETLRKPEIQPYLQDWFDLLQRLKTVLNLQDDDPRFGFNIIPSGAAGLTVNINNRRVLSLFRDKMSFIINDDDLLENIKIPGFIGKSESFAHGNSACLVIFSPASKPFLNSTFLEAWDQALKDSLAVGKSSPYKKFHQPFLSFAAERPDARQLLFKWVREGNPTLEALNGKETKAVFGETLSDLDKNVVEGFTWVPIFQELASKLDEYESNQVDLVDLIKSNHPNPEANLDDEESQGNKIPLTGMDPFTFFAFITKIEDQGKRTQYLAKLKTALSLESVLPKDYTGVPTANAQRLWFFPFKWNSKGFEKEALWRLFLGSQQDLINGEDFNNCLKIFAVGSAKLTQGLFWVNPIMFFPVDSLTIPYLNKHGIDTKLENWSDYQRILDAVSEKFQQPFYELSATAAGAQNTVKSEQPMRYWLAGAMYNGNADQMERFISEGIWENGYDHKYTLITKSVKPGDKIAIKATFTVGPAGEKKGMGRIKAIGEVLENLNDGFQLKVAWEQLPDPINISAVSAYRKTIQELTDRDLIEQIFQTGPINTKHLQRHNMPLNQIFYGPPGTGKTYKLLSLIEQYTTNLQPEDSDSFYLGLVENRTFWEILSVILLEKKSARVPELREHPLIAAKFVTTEIQHPSQRLWSSLQIHTVDDCPNVNLNPGLRHGVSIFYKEPDSSWRLADEAAFKAEFPELVQLYQTYKNGPKAGKREQRYSFITCHQSLTYEDFIEGIKPVLDNDAQVDLNSNLQYQIQKGIFYEACEKAARLAGFDNLRACLKMDSEERAHVFKAIQYNPEKQFAIFLDEINRANIASVFGELITLLEEDKRLGSPNEIIVNHLPYSKKAFGVPPNLYVYGTMNTADRSVEALDTALRRRFSFDAMPPLASAITPINQIDLTLLLETINYRLEVLLDSDHRIGQAYFMGIANSPDPLEALKTTFQKNILPLLQEYFYGDYAKIGAVLGEAFVSKSQKPTGQNSFAKGSWDIDAADYRAVYELTNVDDFDSFDNFIAIYNGTK